MPTSLRIGEILIGGNGEQYRVIGYSQEQVSLMRVNGCTLFACRPAFVQAEFRPVRAVA